MIGNRGKSKAKTEFLKQQAVSRYQNNQDYKSFVHNFISGQLGSGIRKAYLFVTKDAPNSSIQHLFLYLNYKQTLKAFTSSYFEPYCRRVSDPETLVQLDGDIQSSIGQLNFFWWCYQNRDKFLPSIKLTNRVNESTGVELG